MREGWKNKKLGEICLLTMGQSPKSESYNKDGIGMPFFQGCSDFGVLYPIVTTYCSSPQKTAESLDVLISVRAPIGTLNIANEKCCIGRGLASIRALENVSDSKYLYYFLSNAKSDLQNRGSGATFKSIGKDILFNYPINLPPLSIQKQIVSELDLLRFIISQKRQQLKEYDLLAESIFYDMFGNESGFIKKKLVDLTTKIGSGATPKGGNQSYKREGISLIRSMNVHNAQFKYDDLAFIDDDQAAALNNVTLEHGDVLFNITGASVTRCCVVPKDVLPARVNQHVAILRVKSDRLNHLYLSYLLVSKRYHDMLYSLSRSNAATREAITKSQLENFVIPVPPLSLQQLFASRIDALEYQKRLLNESIKQAENLYQSRMFFWFNE